MDLLFRFAKFGAVGGAALVIDVGLFNLLCYVGESPVLAGSPFLAKSASTFVAIVFTWIGNRYWTFRGRRQKQVWREFLRYLLASFAGLSVSLVCLWVSRSILHMDSPLADNVSANLVGLVAGSLFKFWSYQAFVFRGSADAGSATPASRGRQKEAEVTDRSPIPLA